MDDEVERKMNKIRGLTDLEKRLISAMQLGITIESRDGHRWIECKDDMDYVGFESFHEFLQEHGILLNNKIYGTYEDALDVIDNCLKIAKHRTLLEDFWQDDFDEVLGVTGLHSDNRITIVEKGKGGLF